SLNINGGLRTLYDPWTSRLDGAQATRQPFAGNVIPKSRIDPSSQKFLAEMWEPNGPGTDITGRNNSNASFPRNIAYHNISDRTDFNLTDNLRGFFRFSRFRTTLEDVNWTPNKSRIFPNANGGAMNALNVSGDLVWTIDSRTVLNFRSNYTSNNDDYDAPGQYASLATYKEFFPNATDFYTRYLAIGSPFYYPGITIGGGGPRPGGRRGTGWGRAPPPLSDCAQGV